MVKCLLETKDWENITRERKHCESVYENCVHYVCVERKRESIVSAYKNCVHYVCREREKAL